MFTLILFFFIALDKTPYLRLGLISSLKTLKILNIIN